MVTEEAKDEESVEAAASPSGTTSSSSSDDEESLADGSDSSPRGGTQQAEVLESPGSGSDGKRRGCGRNC